MRASLSPASAPSTTSDLPPQRRHGERHVGRLARCASGTVPSGSPAGRPAARISAVPAAAPSPRRAGSPHGAIAPATSMPSGRKGSRWRGIAQHQRQALRHAGEARRLAGLGRCLAVEDHRRHLDQARIGLAQIGLEFGEARHAVLVEVEFMRGDEIEQRLLRQAALRRWRRPALPPPGGRRRCRIDALDGVAPPLQADEADVGLAHRVADPQHLGVEGIERQEMRALVIGREEGREVAVAVLRRGRCPRPRSCAVVHGDQGRGDAALLLQQQIVGGDGVAGGHRVDTSGPPPRAPRAPGCGGRAISRPMPMMSRSICVLLGQHHGEVVGRQRRRDRRSRHRCPTAAPGSSRGATCPRS